MVSVAPPVTNNLWALIFGILREVGKRNPWPLLGLMFVVVFGNLRTGMYVLALSGITQALIEQDRNQAIRWAVVFIVSGLIEQFYWPIKNHLRSMVEDDAAILLQTRVLRKAADSPLELYEDMQFFSTLTRANDDLGRRATLVLAQAMDVLQVLIMFGSILVPIWLIDPLIVGLILLGCSPVFLTTWRTATAFHDVKTLNAQNEHYTNRLKDLMLLRDSAAELRLFGTGPELISRWLATRFRIATDSAHAVGRISMSQFIGEIFAAIGLGSALVVLVSRMLDGRAELGALVAVIFAISLGVGLIGGLAEALRLVRENGAFLGDIFAFEKATTKFNQQHVSVQNAANGPMSVTLRDVSFRYPNTDRDVVRTLNLEIRPGEHIALLGENGAGKSTLVRLIAGLYAPTQGEVLQDGNVATPGRNDIGAVFQDFVRWQLPLRDNVGIGDICHESDDAAILGALESAGIADLPTELEDGLESWLGREFGNRDLSGGQWQRVAIARAFVRNPRLLILDEPTAALDPLAEQRLFEHFRELAAGATSLTISHRIGPARTADRIIVMAHGEIVEIGTHDSLISQPGAYAAMYRAQAEWYQSQTGDTVAEDGCS